MSPFWESKSDWRATAGPPPPNFSSPSSSPTKSSKHDQSPRDVVDRCPVAGQVLRLGKPESIPKDSILQQMIEAEDIGDPWEHPVMVLSVDDLHVTCLQITSKDIVAWSNSWRWASRYVPIAHANLDPAKQHPTPEQPRLKLANGAQMELASSVNVEKTLLVEWSNLEYFNGKRNLVLEKESLDKLRKAKADFIPSPHNSPRTRPAALPYSTNTSETRSRSAPEPRASRSPPIAWRSSTLPSSHLTRRSSTSRSKSDPVDLSKAPTSGAYVPPHLRRAR